MRSTWKFKPSRERERKITIKQYIYRGRIFSDVQLEAFHEKEYDTSIYQGKKSRPINIYSLTLKELPYMVIEYVK